ncbi:MAG: hypothetical protein QMD36_03355 [Candidatus Aenigmarchaeota archaeon]|nr:hypothetical protein [Candidatus Aenigmarchaeota archaeon]
MKNEEIVFWILFILIIAIAIWVLFGSSEVSEAALAIGLLCQGELLAIWRIVSKLEVEMRYIREDLRKSKRKK